MRRELRREVGFCCPVLNCGSPYLTYHHFDPPWAKGGVHNPDGMIALCLQHHKEADVGTYSHEQLRSMKRALKGNVPVSGRFNWRREETLTIAGSNYFIGTPTFLQIGARKLIWLEKDDCGFENLNLDLHASDGTLVFQMRQNDWITFPRDWEDIESNASANRLKLRSKHYNVSVDIIFSQLQIDDVRRLVVRVSKENIKQSIKEYNSNLDRIRDTLIPRKRYADELNRHEDQVMEYIASNLGAKDIQVCQIYLKIVHPINLTMNSRKFEANFGNSSLGFRNSMLGSATVLQL